MNKTCCRCLLEKSLDLFPKDKKTKSGYCSYCKDCANKSNREYYLRIKEKRKEQFKNYYLKNKNRIIKKNSKQKTERRKTNIQEKLKDRLRSRINKAIKGQLKTGSAIKDLGCTVEFLLNYLESKFKKDMTWENYGKWHIDHIKPLSLFNLENRKEFLEACHYSNLQPLWANENLSKGNKYER